MATTTRGAIWARQTLSERPVVTAGFVDPRDDRATNLHTRWHRSAARFGRPKAAADRPGGTMDDTALGAHDVGVLSPIERVTGASAMARLIDYYVASSHDELLSISPGRVPSRLDAQSKLAAAVATGERAVSRRTIYHQRAVRDRVTQRYLHELVELGVLVRLAECIPARALIVDRSIALLTVPGQRDEQMAAVREPSLVAWLVMSFEQLWADSMPLEALASGTRQDVQLAHTQAAILRMLAEGEKDEAISRRLSISVRTCRRHIADYMAQVGASSRFQAGVIAATAGYLTSPF